MDDIMMGERMAVIETKVDLLQKQVSANAKEQHEGFTLLNTKVDSMFQRADEVVPQNFTFGDDVDDNATMFMRQTALKNDRPLIYAVPQVGDALAKAQAYVGL